MTRLAASLGILLTLTLPRLNGQAPAVVQAPQTPEDIVLAVIAAAAEIPPLASSALPPGYREIRIRSEQAWANLEPRPMLRLVEGPNDIRGDVWLFRTLVLRPGNPAPRDDERCAPLRDQHVCVRVGALTSGDWTAVATRLEQLGAWTLSSDPCNPARLVTNDDGSRSFARGILGDAGGLFIQRRVGSTLSSLSCSGPGIHVKTMAGGPTRSTNICWRSAGSRLESPRLSVRG